MMRLRRQRCRFEQFSPSNACTCFQSNVQQQRLFLRHELTCARVREETHNRTF